MNVKLIRQVGTGIACLPLIFLVVMIGLYPLKFFLSEGKVGILNMKSEILLADTIWNVFFYMHISFGGLALLIGWLQFIGPLRQRYTAIHRMIGKVYVFSSWLSVLGVAYIGFFAEGGTIAFLGFMTGGAIWYYTTAKGFMTIRNGKVWEHRKFMIYSYATCVGAVMLRIWLPLLVKTTGNFILSYQVVSWLSWAPNLIVAWLIVKRKESIQEKPELKITKNWVEQ